MAMRIHGRISLAAALLWAGLAHADKPEATKKKSVDANVIMLTGSDGKPHKCQVIKTYKHSSGGMAMEVKDLQTGETMTVIDKSGTSTPTASTSPKSAQTAPTTAQLAATTTNTPKSKTTTADDPIMQPKDLASKKAQKQLTGDNSKPAKAESTSGTTSRWWNGKPAETKTLPRRPAVAVVTVPAMEAVRHPDPVIRLIGCLRDDMMPSMREIAAETLSQNAGRNRPEVIAALAEAAQKDPAPTVRACCLRCLTTMSVSSPECMAALQKLNAESGAVIRVGGAIAR